MKQTIKWIAVSERVPEPKKTPGGQSCLVIADDFGKPVFIQAELYAYGDEPREHNKDRPDWMFSIPGRSNMGVTYWAEEPDVSWVLP